MRIKLRFFGSLSDAFDSDLDDFEVDQGTDTDGLRDLLKKRQPDAEALGDCMIAVNTEYVATARVLCDGDEVAFLPPVSGG